MPAHPGDDAPSVENRTVDRRPGSLNLRGLFLIVAFVAGCLALGRWWFPGYPEVAVAVIVPLAAIPFALLLEKTFSAEPRCPTKPSLKRKLLNLALLVGISLLFPLVYILGISRFRFGALGCSPFLYSTLPYLLFGDEGRHYLLFGDEGPWLIECRSLAPISFLALNFYLARSAGPQPVPWRVPILLTLATSATAYWFATGWTEGIKHQWPGYVYESLALNLVAVVALWTTWFLARRSAGFWTLLGLAVATHAWLFFIAFPWLGVMP